MTKATQLRLTRTEARGLMLAAQGLLGPTPPAPGMSAVRGAIERLGALQVDTISVVERSHYLVLWSRLGPYDATVLDALLFPHRDTFEYWSHAASIVPMSDYAYYRLRMLRAAEHMWAGDREWAKQNPETLRQTLETIRERGPLASADFERPADDRRAQAWDWYGVKDSRRALQILWTVGDLMVHSRRASQRVYDLRERVLADAFGDALPSDADLPSYDAYLEHFARQTARALGVVTPVWLWDYFRLAPPGAPGSRRGLGSALLDKLVEEGALVPAAIEGLADQAYVAVERLPDLRRLRSGLAPERTTLLSPFDSLIWDRARARALFDYEVSFEAYVVPEKRRFGYYCLAILHRGRLVGRLDPKMDRSEGRLIVRALYLEPGIGPDAALLDGLQDALLSLGRFLGAEAIAIERADPPRLAAELQERVGRDPTASTRAG